MKHNQDAPTLENLDRVLMSPTWEDQFPLVYVRKLPRELFDRNPLVVDCRISRALSPKKRTFHFNLNWFNNEQFLSLVQEIWCEPIKISDPIYILISI